MSFYNIIIHVIYIIICIYLYISTCTSCATYNRQYRMSTLDDTGCSACITIPNGEGSAATTIGSSPNRSPMNASMTRNSIKGWCENCNH